MIRVHFDDRESEDFDANAAAPFGQRGVLLSLMEVREGMDPGTFQRITQATNPMLGHIRPQLVAVLAEYRRIEWIDDDQLADGQ